VTLFELSFAITSVILGIALTNIAASLHRLLLAGRRVHWAPEPILLTLLVTVIIVQVWTDQWYIRDIKEFYVGVAFLDVWRMMSLYFAAASALPEADLLGEGEVDLRRYYYATRRLSYGALIVGLWLFGAVFAMFRTPTLLDALQQFVLLPGIYGALILFPRRWLHLLVLLIALGGYGVPTLLATLR
jgi:hypothetical protein